MSSQNHAQQLKLFDPHACQPVTLIGAGSVGSMVATRLAKLGLRSLTAIDHDYVESHNIVMSEYGRLDIGKPKVEALRAIVQRATGLKLTPEHRRFRKEERLVGSVVCCVDSMDVRQEIWDTVQGNPNVDLLIDTRNAEEFISVFAIRPCNPEDVDYYGHFLYSADTALRQTCGRHGTYPIASLTADVALALLTRYWMTGQTKRHHRLMAGTLQTID